MQLAQARWALHSWGALALSPRPQPHPGERAHVPRHVPPLWTLVPCAERHTSPAVPTCSGGSLPFNSVSLVLKTSSLQYVGHVPPPSCLPWFGCYLEVPRAMSVYFSILKRGR